jgi:1,4-alpha-glucan branching enzyme
LERINDNHQMKGRMKHMTTKQQRKTQQPRRKRVAFQFDGGPDCDVRLAGTFNNWNPGGRRLTRKNGNDTYAATLLLARGRHEYKFLVNGEWQCDPACPDWVLNEHGTLNSVVDVR